MQCGNNRHEGLEEGGGWSLMLKSWEAGNWWMGYTQFGLLEILLTFILWSLFFSKNFD